jgi:hypothetical protein
MDAEGMALADDPTLVGGYWVAVHLDDMPAGQIRLHVSIAVGRDDLLRPADITARLTGVSTGPESADSGAPREPGGATELEQLEGPDPAYPLPLVETIGRTAFAQYTFANPHGLSPGVLAVALAGEARRFRLLPA